jgi:Protein phosphatase 2C
MVVRATAHFRHALVLPTEKDVWAWIDDARDHITTAAARREVDAREFAATLIAVVATDQGSLILHVGDGAAVVQIRGEWISPSWPENGAFASTTFFVTDDPAPRLRVTRVEAAQCVAVFSDGLERLVLDFAEKRPHAPFFNGIIRPVEQSQSPGSDAHRPAAPRRQDALQTQAQSRTVAAERHLDGLPGQRFGFALEQHFGRECRAVARALGLAGRVAGAASLKSAILLGPCIFRLGHRTIPAT